MKLTNSSILMYYNIFVSAKIICYHTDDRFLILCLDNLSKCYLSKKWVKKLVEALETKQFMGNLNDNLEKIRNITRAVINMRLVTAMPL
jgi:hypothetical protein